MEKWKIRNYAVKLPKEHVFFQGVFLGVFLCTLLPPIFNVLVRSIFWPILFFVLIYCNILVSFGAWIFLFIFGFPLELCCCSSSVGLVIIFFIFSQLSIMCFIKYSLGFKILLFCLISLGFKIFFFLN